jgi:nucleotide-binding universal stress UspA family protein
VHVLVATDGELDATATANFAARLAGPDGRVTVLTVVEVPRAFLHDMRVDWGAPEGTGRLVDDSYVVTPAVPKEAPHGWPGDDALVDRYLSDKKDQYTAPVVDALQSAEIHTDARVVESENVSLTIINQCAELGADVVVIGSHGRGLVQGLLGSNGTKIVRRSPIPVLLIRTTSS